MFPPTPSWTSESDRTAPYQRDMCRRIPEVARASELWGLKESGGAREEAQLVPE